MQWQLKFNLLDRITELVPGVRIAGVKRLSGEEDYLIDHFPRFPVMPGVLMLESVYQASMWLIRQSEGFANSVVILKEARNIKFSDLITPGKELVVMAEIIKQDGPLTTLKVQGTVDDKLAIIGRLVLEKFNLAERVPNRRITDPYLRDHFRSVLKQLLPAEIGTTET